MEEIRGGMKSEMVAVAYQGHLLVYAGSASFGGACSDCKWGCFPERSLVVLGYPAEQSWVLVGSQQGHVGAGVAAAAVAA